MELNLDNKVERVVKFGGVAYKVAPLKVRDQKEMQVSLKGLDPDSLEYFDAMLKFIERVGIPKNVIEDMDAEQLKSFMEFIVGTKKN